MTYFNLMNSQEAITRLSQEKLKVKDAVKIARLIKKLSEEGEVFAAQRKAILEQYGEEVEEGFKIREDCINEFNEAMSELLTTELEGKYEAIEVESEVDISVSDIIAMEGFITFKE